MKLAAIKHALEERERQLPRPKLAEGTELIGEYEGSGFKEPQFIARRADGRVLQLPHLLFVVAAASDGTRDLREIADILREDLHRNVTIDNVKYLVDEKLRPLGVLETEQGESPELPPHEPLLALKFKQAVIPPAAVNVAARIFKPLFFPLVIGAVLAWLVTLDVWLFFHHGVAAGVRELLYKPSLLVGMLGLLAVSALFHECGHATACRYGGARPGAMGAGLYIVWPAFYTDVTDAYRLNRVGRLRTDLGGVYFNVVFILGAAGVYFWTGFEPLLALIALQHVEIIHQFVPWVRLDGYYVVSDLTGVPDVMSRIMPTLLSLIPGRETDPRVAQLKPWVRGVVTLYVVTVIPILVAFAGLMLVSAPHVATTAVSSGKLEVARITSAFADRDALDVFVGGVQLIVLALPPIGLALTLLKLGRTTTLHVVRGLAPRPKLRAAAVVLAGAAAIIAGMNWWSTDAFNAIGQADRGTFQSAKGALRLTRRPRLHPSTPAEPARKRSFDQVGNPTVSQTDTAATTTTPDTTTPSRTEPTTTRGATIRGTTTATTRSATKPSRTPPPTRTEAPAPTTAPAPSTPATTATPTETATTPSTTTPSTTTTTP
jgi:putative peptide zinc metalloprotease protein